MWHHLYILTEQIASCARIEFHWWTLPTGYDTPYLIGAHGRALVLSPVRLSTFWARWSIADQRCVCFRRARFLVLHTFTMGQIPVYSMPSEWSSFPLECADCVIQPRPRIRFNELWHGTQRECHATEWVPLEVAWSGSRQALRMYSTYVFTNKARQVEF